MSDTPDFKKIARDLVHLLYKGCYVGDVVSLLSDECDPNDFIRLRGKGLGMDMDCEIFESIEAAMEAFYGDELPAMLDEMVHESKGQEAAVINNNGPHEQLEYLLESHRISDLAELIEGSAHK